MGPKVRIIDEIYQHYTIAQDIIPIVMARPWWKHIKEKAGVIDNAGQQHQGNKSQVEIWREMAHVALRSTYVFQDDGLHRFQLGLQEIGDDNKPLLMFDYRLDASIGYDGRAKGILGELNLFKWRDWKEGKNNAAAPIDANNDAIKATWYWLYDRYGPVVERKRQTKKVTRAYWA